MRQSTYILHPGDSAKARGYLQIQIEEAGLQPRTCLLPVDRGFSFFVTTGREVKLTFPQDQAVLKPAGWATAALARLPWYLKKPLRHGVLNFGNVTIFPAGGKQQYKTYCRHVIHARNFRIPPDGQIMRDHPELITGWPLAPAVETPKVVGGPRIAVALHLYYTDLWPEIETLLGRWQLPFTLFLTLTQEDQELARRVNAAFPGSIIRIVENSGRDVRPFLLLLEDGAFNGFDFVCKIHGKKSLGHGRLPIFGDIFRRATFLDLIATNEIVQSIINIFQRDPQIGIVGPGRYRVASTHLEPRDVFGNNRAAVEAIAARMGRPVQDDDFDFFAGTMFWVRPAALAPLKDLGLSAEFDPAQSGYLDGAVEHALERLFTHTVRVAGFRAQEVRDENHCDQA